MSEISIVIVTYNSDHLIFDCLNSILSNNDIGEKLEIIIVDNCSKNTDVMFSKIKAHFKDRVRLIKNKFNNGYGAGNNIGIKAAASPFVMIMNPDVRLIEPIFIKVLTSFKKPKLALLGLKQMESPIKKRYSFGTLELGIVQEIQLKFFNWFDLFNQNVFCISGACFFVRTEMMKEAGLFDEEIFLYGEERDLHVRLLKSKNFIIKFLPSLRYLHPKEHREFSLNVHLAQFKSYLYWLKKNNYKVQPMLKKYKRLLQYKKFIALITKNMNKYIVYQELILKIKAETIYEQ